MAGTHDPAKKINQAIEKLKRQHGGKTKPVKMPKKKGK